MLEIATRSREALPRIAVRWARVRSRGQPRGSLPDPSRVVPKRDPATLADEPVARAYRELFRELGLDPTKTRPAGEALARRVAQGKGLPEILPLVDAYNMASAATLVPFSAFDADHVVGGLELCTLETAAAFDPIGGQLVTLEPGQVGWCDQEGVVSQFLHRDAKRTRIRASTEEAFLVVAGPSALAPRVLPQAFRTLEPLLDIAGWELEEGPATLTV